MPSYRHGHGHGHSHGHGHGHGHDHGQCHGQYRKIYYNLQIAIFINFGQFYDNIKNTPNKVKVKPQFKR